MDFVALGENAIIVALRRLTDTDEPDLWLDVLDEIADGPRASEAEVEELVAAWTGSAREQGLMT